MRKLFLFSAAISTSICHAASLLPRGRANDDNSGQQHIFSLNAQPNPLFSPPSYRHSRGFVALGDSYSAGIGTGLDGQYLVSEGDCRRGQHGYPLLLHADLDNTTGTNTSFQWLSCTGAVTTDLLSGVDPSSQIDAINTSLPLDFATLSIGGNDLGFFNVMNACIFRFYSFYSGTCAAALAASDAALASGVFEHRLEIILHEILDAVAWEKRPFFSLTVTGYARFFNDQTPECDAMSLGVWWGGPKLSREIRGRMNALVDAANDKLRRAVARAAARFRGPRPRVLFADYNALFEGHRFCEPGVVEPAYERIESWFFLVGGPDNARNETTWPNGTNGDPPNSDPPNSDHPPPDDDGAMMMLSPASELVNPQTCLHNAQATGDWGELALCYMAVAKSRDPSLRPAYGGVTAQNGMWWVPTSYGKTFHPRTMGCEAIRDHIYDIWREYGL
ncbi:SGNH hydrolase [Cryphonectria parasitica EP155]|uniref:SGNH hydrolase n=1 Tax=Cryphonectria parasitica (strain ATCC 38755 / EP155) TaxID=660469 RepID=A0A9P4YBP2_CRYP1|nr:SGNH hydrolase [Cryphonectria parasitica EP155]KAF3770512.1 SGNH hydrolase [Cryphonectria parasitica EP155]